MGFRVLHFNVARFICRKHEEHPVVATAFVQLTRGMQIARSDLQARRDAAALRDAVANLFKRLATTFAREGQEGVQGEVIARLDTAAKRGDRARNRFIDERVFQRLGNVHFDLAHGTPARPF